MDRLELSFLSYHRYSWKRILTPQYERNRATQTAKAPTFWVLHVHQTQTAEARRDRR